jgi:N-acetylglucosaminyl-diphospho-decaprenol L-rhamnosyltransferase
MPSEMTGTLTSHGGIDVAVVIVTYKCAAVTVDCLASLDAERRDPGSSMRVIVVDNASGDLPFIAEAVQRNAWSSWVTLLPAPKNGGFAYGNNLGIEAAYRARRPDYVYLLNPDTQVRPGAVATLLDFMQSRPDVGLAGPSFETENGADWPFAFRFPSLLSEVEHGMQLGLITRLLSPWVVPRTMSAKIQQTDWISGASIMIRPAVLSAVGCLDENFFLYFEETEFCHRARRAGFSTWYVPSSRVMHMIGKSTSVNDDSRFRRRLPGYWFESRARYYAVTHGPATAALIDIAAVASSMLGLLKNKLQRRPNTPHYIRDLIAHSTLWARNRRTAPLRSFFPPS